MKLPIGKDIPAPSIMPIERELWAGQLHLSNFVNTYCQFRDLQNIGELSRLLIVGPGQGLDTQVLRWRGYEVTTFDIDDTFKPDVIGSVHDLSMFTDSYFDAILVSHVLEHLAEPYLDTALAEIARVGRYALIYLPVAGRHCQLRFQPGVKGLDLSFIVDLFNRFSKPDGVTPKYCGGQHFWELGMRGFRIPDMIQRFNRNFEVLRHYRNRDWNPSHNFILKAAITK